MMHLNTNSLSFFQTAVLILAQEASPVRPDDIAFLAPAAGLFEEFTEGRIPVVRWQEVLRLLPEEEASGSSSTDMDCQQDEHPTEAAPLQVTPATSSTPLQDSCPNPPAASSTSLQDSPAIPPTKGTTPGQEGQDIPMRPSASSLLGPNSAPPKSPTRAVSIAPSSLSRKVASPPRRAQSLSAVPVGGLPTTSATQQLPPTNTASEVPARPTTGGKSLEYLAKLGLAHSSRMKVTLKRGRVAEDKDEFVDVGDSQDEGETDGGIDGDDDDDDFVSGSEQRPKKKRRVVSAPFINDSDDDRRVKPVSQKRSLNRWPTFPSPVPCDPCVFGGKECRTFELYPEGFKSQKQRRSCTICYLRKRKCPFNNIQRSDDDPKRSQKDKSKSKERPKPKSRKPSTKSKKAHESEGDSDIEKSRRRQAKGKAKEKEHGTGKEKEKGDDDDDDDDDMEGDDPAPQRPSRNRQARYRSGKFVIVFNVFFSGS